MAASDLPALPSYEPASWNGNANILAGDHFIGTTLDNRIWGVGFRNLGASGVSGGATGYSYDVNHKDNVPDIMGPFGISVQMGDSLGGSYASHVVLSIVQGNITANNPDGSGQITYPYTGGTIETASNSTGSGVGIATPGILINPTLSDFVLQFKGTFPTGGSLWSSCWLIDWVSGLFTEIDLLEDSGSGRACQSNYHTNGYKYQSSFGDWGTQPTASDQIYCVYIPKGGNNILIFQQPQGFTTPVGTLTIPSGGSIPSNCGLAFNFNHSLASNPGGQVTAVSSWDYWVLYGNPGNSNVFLGTNLSSQLIANGTTVPGSGGGGGGGAIPPPAGMYQTPAIVAGSKNSGTVSPPGGSTTSYVFDPTLAGSHIATEGNTIRLGIAAYGGANLKLGLQVPAPYTLVKQVGSGTSNNPFLATYLIQGCAAANEFGSITATSLNGMAMYISWWIEEWSGFNTTVVPDAVSGTNNTGTTTDTMPFTMPSQLYTNEVCFCDCACGAQGTQTQATSIAMTTGTSGAWTDANDTSATFSGGGELAYTFYQTGSATQSNGTLSANQQPQMYSLVTFALQPALEASAQLATPAGVAGSVACQTINVSWNAVTTDINGNPATPAGYEVSDALSGTTTQVSGTTYSAPGNPFGQHIITVKALAATGSGNSNSNGAITSVTVQQSQQTGGNPHYGGGVEYVS